MNKKALYITTSVVLLTLLMNFIDVFINPQYFIRSLIKIILFLIVPIIYFLIFKDEMSHIKQLFIPKKKSFFQSLLLGIIVYVIIIGIALILRNIIDFTSITKSLTSDTGVNKDNFIYVSLYISFFNSFLEEFFFRGYSFITLKRQIDRKFTYIFSSLIFALYHIGMILGWFNIIIFILAFLGLFIGGCVFNYLNEKNNHIYYSWLVHMFGNFAINTIGFIAYGII